MINALSKRFGKAGQPSSSATGRQPQLPPVPKAVDGDASTLFLVAESYAQIERYDDALVWYRAAAEHGLQPAQFSLGMLLARRETYGEAAQWFGKAAEQGDVAEARYQQGRCLSKMPSAIGGDAKRDKQVFEAYEIAAGMGLLEAKYKLGKCYLEGRGVEKNHQLGKRHLYGAARRQHAKAANLLLRLGLVQRGRPEKETAEERSRRAIETISVYFLTHPELLNARNIFLEYDVLAGQHSIRRVSDQLFCELVDLSQCDTLALAHVMCSSILGLRSHMKQGALLSRDFKSLEQLPSGDRELVQKIIRVVQAVVANESNEVHFEGVGRHIGRLLFPEEDSLDGTEKWINKAMELFQAKLD